jgi:hypothetical protein
VGTNLILAAAQAVLLLLSAATDDGKATEAKPTAPQCAGVPDDCERFANEDPWQGIVSQGNNK